LCIPACSLPFQIIGVTVIPFGDSFMLVGGYNGITRMDTVFLYDVDNDAWHMVAKLRHPKSIVIAMIVDNKMFAV
jgi:hypothetical protein